MRATAATARAAFGRSAPDNARGDGGRINPVSQPAFDFGDEPYDDPANPTYSVGELADAINAQLRRGFGDGVWVRGEIQGWNERGNHAYFRLVEEREAGKAVLDVQFFANVRMKLRPLLQKHRLRLGDGMTVRIFGHLDYFAAGGRLGLKMSGIDPRFTLGELAMARDDVVRRLVASGMFDANRRHRLSPVPLRLGVVTSVGTAAWHDFHDELRRSGLGFHLHVVDTRVQGEHAVEMVAAAVRTLSRRGDLDAVVMIRGGGARNELATFDAEPIALAIAASPVPVLTGLGHEVDRSVADEVAHTALKTPTACASTVVERVRQYARECEDRWDRIVHTARRDAHTATGALTDRAHRIARRTHAAVERADERLATRSTRLRHVATRPLDQADAHLRRSVDRLARRPAGVLAAEARHLDSLASRVAALDPVTMLARGWSITRTADGRALRSVTDAAPGAVLTTVLSDGAVSSRVLDPARATREDGPDVHADA
jgi:exodeoxyribonuclease VII large subunit